jgi:hypothetical protein
MVQFFAGLSSGRTILPRATACFVLLESGLAEIIGKYSSTSMTAKLATTRTAKIQNGGT